MERWDSMSYGKQGKARPGFVNKIWHNLGCRKL